MNAFLRPLSYLYGYFSQLHRSVYEKSILKTVSMNKPVISIGNLTVGGTGKTPFVLKLVQDFSKRNIKAAVVVRSYRGSMQSSQELNIDNAKDPSIYGDEACVYKIKNPHLKVYTGPSKWKSAQLADLEKNVDVILIDDGFQHHKLKKDWNGVLLDATRVEEWQLLPEGKLREGFSSLEKADAVFLTRTELVDKNVLDQIRSRIPQNKPYFLMKTKYRNLRGFDGRILNEKNIKKVGLVCALGNPTQFEEFFKSHHKNTAVVPFFYRDHHPYNSTNVSFLENEMVRQGLDFLITTEKDEVKLRKYASRPHNWAVLDIETEFVNEDEWQQYWDRKVNEMVGSRH